MSSSGDPSLTESQTDSSVFTAHCKTDASQRSLDSNIARIHDRAWRGGVNKCEPETESERNAFTGRQDRANRGGRGGVGDFTRRCGKNTQGHQISLST